MKPIRKAGQAQRPKRSLSSRRKKAPEGGISRDLVAQELLTPILKFLIASGITSDIASDAFDTAWKRAARSKSRVSVVPLANTDLYRDIVAAWVSRPSYLDSSGRPRVLAIRGKKSFSELVASVDPAMTVTDAISVLRRYGNVRRMSDNRIKLLSSFFHVRSDRLLAFEPSVRFLADASATINAIMSKSPHNSRAAPHFWRIAEARQLPLSQMKPYIEFVRRRSLGYLQEVDEWLRAHDPVHKRGEKRVRAGVGLFSICDEN